VPAGLTNVVAVTEGASHSAALRCDGTVLCWGNNDNGQCGTPTGLSGVVSIKAADNFTAALKSDGTVVCWGRNDNGRCDVPVGLTNAVTITAGTYHALAYTRDGRVVGWGLNSEGEAASFRPHVPVLGFAAGQRSSFALVGGCTDPNDPDSDGDGLDDGEEAAIDGTDPNNKDTDGDILTDGDEVLVFGTDPENNDTDVDGLTDGDEVLVFGTDPENNDTDVDGLTDGDEVLVFGTDPESQDTDMDGMPDKWEVNNGLDPLSGLDGTLAGWWQFREGTGTNSLDLSGHGNTAYILYTNHVNWVTGAPVGAALRFDPSTNGAPAGYGGYVCVPGLSNAPVSSGFTMAAWVRADSYPSFATVMAKTSDYGGWTDGTVLYHLDGESLDFYAGTWGCGNRYAASGFSGTGVWVHVCGVYDGTNASLYVNGQFRNVITNAAGSVVNGEPLWIGSIFCDNDRWLWDGDIADVRFYTSALSTNQILGLLEFQADPDGDGLTNVGERDIGTDPFNSDTDKDGLTDREEVCVNVIEWGLPYAGTAAVARPSSLGVAMSVSAGRFHAAVRRSDGTVVCWGINDGGQCSPPADLTNAIAVAAGTTHTVALRRDGTVGCWGDNGAGQCNVPAGLANVTAIAAGLCHTAALTSGGHVVCWGDGDRELYNSAPAGLSNAVAVAAGDFHTAALTSDGRVVCWGDNTAGQTDVPADLSNAVAVAAGGLHTVALRRDGTVACWGLNSNGECDAPTGLPRVVRIGAGTYHSLAYTSDGRVVCWGDNGDGQSESFQTNAPVAYVGGGQHYSLALLGRGTDPLNPDTDGDGIPDGEDETPCTPGPSITVCSPLEGAVLTNSPVTVSGVVRFDGVLDSVRVRGTLAATYNQGGGTYAFTNGLSLDEGSHEIEVRAMGVGAPPPESRKTVAVTVDALPPDVIILSPTNGQSFAGANVRVTVWTDASNDVVTVNNTATTRDGNIRYAWVRLPSAGTGIAIQATAADSRNRVGTDTVTVACTDDTYTDPGDDDNDGVPNGEDPAPNDPAVRSTVVITDPPNGITIYSN
jgi:alpha-tubulin suppressor-like RCC1 family protein